MTRSHNLETSGGRHWPSLPNPFRRHSYFIQMELPVRHLVSPPAYPALKSR